MYIQTRVTNVHVGVESLAEKLFCMYEKIFYSSAQLGG